MNSGRIIKALREKKGISQAELGRKIGISRSSISMYESEERIPTVEIYENLADFFNVDVDFLMGRSDKTTVLVERLEYENKNLTEDARFLLDKIPSMSEKQLKQLRKLSDIIAEE